MEELTPFTLDDAYGVADLETARTPDSPIAGAMMAYWWTHPTEGMRSMRWVARRDGAINVFVEASHDAWAEGERRFGWVQASIHPDDWTEAGYREGIATAETWLRGERAEAAVATIREDFSRELSVLAELGYAEERRERYWELDLVARKGELLTTAEKSRAEMRRQGIELLTLDRNDDAETLQKLYELDVAATKDVPTTVPIRMSGFETWYRQYFENPGVSKDTFWIAKLDGEVVGMSVIEFPPERGVPSTWFTGVSAGPRGRGIARRMK